MLQEAFFDAPGVSTHYVEGPCAGPPLLLLHGGSARWQSFEPIIPSLAIQFHVFALDFRGHGRSSRTPGRYRIADHVSDVEAFIEGVIERPAIVFGHSFGAQVGLPLAARYPHLVRGLILGDIPVMRSRLRELIEGQQHIAMMRRISGGSTPRDNIAAIVRRMPIRVGPGGEVRPAEEVFGADSDWFASVAETLYEHDPDFLAAVTDRFDDTFADWDGPALLPRVRCPVLLLRADSEFGGLVSDADVSEARRLLPGIVVVRIAGVGHALHMQDGAAVLRAIGPFLDSLASVQLTGRK